MAYLMKEYRMTRQEAYDFVKEKRGCIMPNSAFWKQLETYEGILQAKLVSTWIIIIIIFISIIHGL